MENETYEPAPSFEIDCSCGGKVGRLGFDSMEPNDVFCQSCGAFWQHYTDEELEAMPEEKAGDPPLPMAAVERVLRTLHNHRTKQAMPKSKRKRA